MKYTITIFGDKIDVAPQTESGGSKVLHAVFEKGTKVRKVELSLKGDKVSRIKVTKGDGHLKTIVTGLFLYWITFVVITYITFWVKGEIPDTLVQVGLGGGTFELICTTVIEVIKKIFDKDKDKGETNYG